MVDQDFIPRFTTTATIVIEGCKPIAKDQKITPKEVEDQYIMWTGIGYAPCSEIVAVRCSQDGVDSRLRGTLPNGHCELGDDGPKVVHGRGLVHVPGEKAKRDSKE